MVDLTEWGLFLATVVADAIALYAVLVGFRNQARVTDRDRRRESYASLLTSYQTTKGYIKDAAALIRLTGILEIQEGTPTVPKDSPAGKRLVTILGLWTMLSRWGTPPAPSEVAKLAARSLSEPETSLALQAFSVLVRKIGENEDEIRRTTQLLELSGIPSDVRSAVNALAVEMESKLAGPEVTFSEDFNWRWLDTALARLAKLMREDLGSGRLVGD